MDRGNGGPTDRGTPVARALSSDVEQELRSAIAAFDTGELRRAYVENGEFLVLDRFLPPAFLEDWEAQRKLLLPYIHRSVIPKHKAGGSVSYPAVIRFAPTIRDVYHSPALRSFLCEIVGCHIQTCPAHDRHACAVYCYTRPADHIGYHYDTSYYLDRRYTLLLGLRNHSKSKLVYRLHTKNRSRPVEQGAFRLFPGSFVLFNGDTVQHKVTPLDEGEERFVVTMQYVTDPRMRVHRKFVSQMKDALAYFGFRAVFGVLPIHLPDLDGQPADDGDGALS